MADGYASFLIRCRRREGGALRLTVEHVQSGRRTVVASLPAALAWLAAHVGAEPADDRGGDDSSPGPRGAAPR